MTRTETFEATSQRVAATTMDQSENSRRRTYATMLIGFFVFATITLLCSVALSQQPKYDVLPLNPALDVDKKVRSMKRDAAAYATSRELNNFGSDRMQNVQTYFQQYVPRKITQRDADSEITDLMNHSTDLVFRALKSNPGHGDKMMRWITPGLLEVAKKNTAPAARINAILFISRLGKTDPSTGLPIPYSMVLRELLPIYQDANAPDGVRAAALKGLERFVRYMPESRKSEADKALLTDLSDEMTKLLQAKSPAGRDPMAHAFLQRYAVSIQTNLSQDASFGKELVSVSSNEDTPGFLAIHSAGAIADLPAKVSPDDFDTEQVLKSWAKRLLIAYQLELDRLDRMERTAKTRTQPVAPERFVKKKTSPEEEEEQARSSRGMPGGRGGMMEMMQGMEEMGMMEAMGSMDMMEMMGGPGMAAGGMFGMRGAERPKEPEVVASLKKLNYTFQQLMKGLVGSGVQISEEDIEDLQAEKGLLASASEMEMDSAKNWLETISALATELNDPAVADKRALNKVLVTQMDVLQELADGKNVDVDQMVDDHSDLFNALDSFGPEPGAGGPAGPGGPAAPAATDEDAALEALLNQ